MKNFVFHFVLRSTCNNFDNLGGASAIEASFIAFGLHMICFEPTKLAKNIEMESRKWRKEVVLNYLWSRRTAQEGRPYMQPC